MTRTRTRRFPTLASATWILLLTWAAMGACANAPEPQPDAQRLQPGVPVERRLTAGEVHAYEAELAAGRHWRVAVEQRGIDVVVEVTGPDARTLGTVNAPTYRELTESFLVSAAEAGIYRIEVRSANPAVGPGDYEILIRELSDATPEDRRLLEAEAAVTAAARLSFQATPETRRQAIEKYQEALAHWRALGKKREQAQALVAMGVLYTKGGKHDSALKLYRSALPLLEDLGEHLGKAIVLSNMGNALRELDDYEKAHDRLQQAISLQQDLENRFGEAIAHNNLCLVLQDQGELRKARECLQQALERLRRLGELEWEGTLLNNIGGAYENLGEPQLALEHHRWALALRQKSGVRKKIAGSHNNIGKVYSDIGEFEKALSHYQQAWDIFRKEKNDFWQARALNNMGTVYYRLGDFQRARSLLQKETLPLRQRAKDRSGEAITLGNLGLVYSSLGEHGQALESHRRALELSSGNRQREATALYQMGRGYLALGDLAAALEHFDRALERLPAAGDRGKRADFLHQQGEVLLRRGEPEEALARLSAPLELRRQIGDRNGEAQTLRAVAQSLAMLGRGREAREHLEAALEVIESLRTRVSDPTLRASFLSSQRQAYELSIDLWMKAHAGAPDRGHDRAALAASERARARSLLDLVQEADADLGIDPALREQQRSLLQRLNAKVTKQIEEKAPASELELDLVLTELEIVEAEILRATPRYGAFTQPRTLSAEEIHSLLDPDTMLLEYALGEERSFLWAVTASSFTSFELDAREEIESDVREVVQELRTLDPRGTKDEWEKAGALSHVLLGPVAGLLDGQRLVIVADGALHYLPFAALPIPETGSSPGAALRAETLVERHEIVYLPSASTLAVQRQQLAGRPPAPQWVAVLADPVFRAGDQRMRSASTRSAPPPGAAMPRSPAPQGERSAQGGAAAGYDRLPATRDEAERIAAFAAPGKALTATGFDASRALALSPELSRYRIVHFATHGRINAQRPELSHLALSQFDEQGQPQDGFLGLRDVYNLDWGADLVVLSGCETALGKQIRGEGLVGLTRGFMYAGVPRVVASLWRVQDRPTTELMTRFYRSMLVQGQPPAAALREAQLSMLKERRRADPYYWAAFVLQGDWRFSSPSSKKE